MNIDTRKLAFIQKFTQLSDESVLEKFEQLMDLENEHFKPMSVDEYKNHVEEGLADYKTDRLTDQVDFEDEIKNW